VTDPATSSLEGRRIRKVRQSVHRLERAGYTAEFRWAGEVGRDLRQKLRLIETAWLGDRARRGHTMTIDHLFRLGGKDALFVLGLDESGTVRGFLHFATCRASAGLSLSSMPRTPGTPNGFNEWLVTSAVHWARENG